MYHATISRLGMYDLLAGLSVADAAAEDFHTLTDKKDLTAVHLGVRWTILDGVHEVRVFGPKSDPSNVILVDLLDVKDGLPMWSVPGEQTR